VKLVETTQQLLCPFCRDVLIDKELVSIAPCANCGASHHTECWLEYGKCSSCKHLQTGIAALPTSILIVSPKFNEQLLAIFVDVPLILVCNALFILLELGFSIACVGYEISCLLFEGVQLSFESVSKLISYMRRPAVKQHVGIISDD